MDRLNIELFKKVRERIATVPASYNQENWILESDAAPCGYAACLAGETIICAAPTVQDGIAELNQMMQNRITADGRISGKAAKLLGLKGSWVAFCNSKDPRDGGETLIFDPDVRFWPADLKEQFRDGETHDAALALLDRIIAEQEVPVDYGD